MITQEESLGIPDSVWVISTSPRPRAPSSPPIKPPVPPQAEKTPSGRPLRPLMSLERARALGIPDRVLVIETPKK
jgi:hypothetical protein